MIRWLELISVSADLCFSCLNDNGINSPVELAAVLLNFHKCERHIFSGMLSYISLCSLTPGLLRTPEDSWGLLRTPEDSWGLLRTPEDSWGLLRTPEDSWGLLRTPEDSWGLLRTPEDSWGLLRTPEDSWGLRRTHEDSGVVEASIVCFPTVFLLFEALYFITHDKRRTTVSLSDAFTTFNKLKYLSLMPKHRRQ